MRREHLALIAKVEAFTSVAFARRRADMACAQGCSSCCEVSLTVTAVEAAEIRLGLAALPPSERALIAERGATELANTDEDTQRCAMLDSAGRCTVYAYRPLVCRTQGHALRYPAGFIPEGAVRARSKSGDVTYCPLNFTEAAPEPADVLDAERVDQILAVVAQRFARAQGTDPSARISLSELAVQSSRPGANR